ncbi:hypothetical protein HanRHA438_Chr10g0440711 [Helianthus annuus]|uniref:Uncharacterized protein n=1 Tax=Helianthus annuus TaxID=4232 RepID=A0A251THD9_HELAN|nr:hypothetical protein HanRHA438_Chr10g0440711 [Helianthus annuus]
MERWIAVCPWETRVIPRHITSTRAVKMNKPAKKIKHAKTNMFISDALVPPFRCECVRNLVPDQELLKRIRSAEQCSAGCFFNTCVFYATFLSNPPPLIVFFQFRTSFIGFDGCHVRVWERVLAGRREVWARLPSCTAR